MNEEELIFLVAVTVVMPIVALWIILNYQKARMKIKREQPDQSLTTSELNTLIDDSVASATAQLSDRLSNLEKQLRLIGPPAQVMQDDFEETESENSPIKTLGRTRS